MIVKHFNLNLICWGYWIFWTHQTGMLENVHNKLPLSVKYMKVGVTYKPFTATLIYRCLYAKKRELNKLMIASTSKYTNITRVNWCRRTSWDRVPWREFRCATFDPVVNWRIKPLRAFGAWTSRYFTRSKSSLRTTKYLSGIWPPSLPFMKDRLRWILFESTHTSQVPHVTSLPSVDKSLPVVGLAWRQRKCAPSLRDRDWRECCTEHLTSGWSITSQTATQLSESPSRLLSQVFDAGEYVMETRKSLER